MKKVALFWFRRDLRLYDNHGLFEALQAKDTEYFQQEVDKLQKWADDKILASEKELKDVKSFR